MSQLSKRGITFLLYVNRIFIFTNRSLEILWREKTASDHLVGAIVKRECQHNILFVIIKFSD